MTEVCAEPALAKLAEPGPLTRLQLVVTAAGGLGSPSSLTLPVSDSGTSSSTVRLAPALTDGAVFGTGAAVTVMATSSLRVNSPSLAVSRKT